MDKLILIHDSLGTEKELKQIKSFLPKTFKIYTYEIPHHGNKSTSTIDYKIEAITNDFLSFLKDVGTSYIYGIGLGGYIALNTALKNNTNIRGIVTQGAKFDWDSIEVEKEIERLSIEKLENSPELFDYLNNLHGENLPTLLKKTKAFYQDLISHPPITDESIRNLNISIRLTRGGQDEFVTKEETIAIKNEIKNSFYFEIPSFTHSLGFINPKHVARLIEVQIGSFSYEWTNTSFGRMSYKKYGNLSNINTPVLLFLHEAIGSIAQWKTFPERLCAALKLPGIAIELPGYGFSDNDSTIRNEQYLHDFSLKYLPSFIESINLQNPIIIIGHSDGGTNALLFSSKYPEKVKAIVTLAAHYINEPETRAGIQPAIDAFEQGKLKGLELYHGDKTERLFYAWANTWNLTSFKNWNISNEIKNNPVPALILQGDNDQYGTDEQVNGIVDLLQNAQSYFIKNCGHQLFLEHEKKVIEIIKNWLEKDFSVV